MKAILGIDEVGRGPWAGPLVVGACILGPAIEKPSFSEQPSNSKRVNSQEQSYVQGQPSKSNWIDSLTDSKKLSPKRRETLASQIYKHASAVGLGWVSSRELDQIGLSKALSLATRRAIYEIKLKQVPFSEIIIDGTLNFLKDTPLSNYVTTLKKADLLIKEVSAASIVAKVARDHYMASLAESYPNYGFENHVGYGTAAHRAALENFGPCPEHRFSFAPIAKISSSTCKEQTKVGLYTSTQKGNHAENLVAEYLSERGHQIVARNHRTKFYEIDIISTYGNNIYFTEVKYRESSSHGGAVSAITPAKLRQMTFAAEAFLQYSPFLAQNFSPLLAAAFVSGSDFHIDDWFELSA
ncbi:ribonuclease HII [Candidatus Saccharibacteria bacterium]|nr:ribonuclease HII [Candidatus Saccharibacteria bacterium]